MARVSFIFYNINTYLFCIRETVGTSVKKKKFYDCVQFLVFFRPGYFRIFLQNLIQYPGFCWKWSSRKISFQSHLCLLTSLFWMTQSRLEIFTSDLYEFEKFHSFVEFILFELLWPSLKNLKRRHWIGPWPNFG